MDLELSDEQVWIEESVGTLLDRQWPPAQDAWQAGAPERARLWESLVEFGLLSGAGTDLVRFGQFSDHGIWQWKGGVKSGQACDHWNRYKEDLEIAAELKLNSYRFSVEWSRIATLSDETARYYGYNVAEFPKARQDIFRFFKNADPEWRNLVMDCAIFIEYQDRELIPLRKELHQFYERTNDTVRAATSDRRS